MNRATESASVARRRSAGLTFDRVCGVGNCWRIGKSARLRGGDREVGFLDDAAKEMLQKLAGCAFLIVSAACARVRSGRIAHGGKGLVVAHRRPLAMYGCRRPAIGGRQEPE